MCLKYLFLNAICISLSFAVRLFAQNKENITGKDFENADRIVNSPGDTSDYLWRPCTSPFLEVLGKGFASLNVDFRRKETYAISIGVAGIEEGVAPNVMGYYFAGKRHRLETGGGISGNISGGTVMHLVVHGVIGYRYQKKKGVFFRAGFTPMFEIPLTDEGKYAFIPWAGISLGYSF